MFVIHRRRRAVPAAAHCTAGRACDPAPASSPGVCRRHDLRLAPRPAELWRPARPPPRARGDAAVMARGMAVHRKGVCMPSVFLSYSRADHYFAELAALTLRAHGIEVWRDQRSLRAGADWRQGIERLINESVAILVALSGNSANSPYVTYESRARGSRPHRRTVPRADCAERVDLSFGEAPRRKTADRQGGAVARFAQHSHREGSA